jgi:hypothetical protein
MYVEGNPTNFTDPRGLWRWALTSSIYHFLIENYYEGTFGLANPFRQLEYRIPVSGTRVDMFDTLTGAVFEIEPWFLAYSTSPRHGAQQALNYVLQLNASRNNLRGTYYDGTPYDWRYATFRLGMKKDWPGKYRTVMPGFPSWYLVADYVMPGVISYWLEPNGLIPVPVFVPNKKLVKSENWKPQRALQPVYVLSFQEACGLAMVVVGGTILVVTIVEDVATLGLGTFDDVVTIPAGLLFINFGQRIAVPIIAR